MKRVRVIKYIFGLFLVGLGVVIGIAIRHYNDIPLAETINVIDVATLVTTIFLAVYIPEVMDRQLQVKRDKKALLEEHVDELQAFYRKINIAVQQETISPKDRLMIQNILDVSSSRLDTFITLLTVADMRTSFAEEIEELKVLSRKYRELLSVDLNEITPEIKMQEETLYNLIDKKTSLLVFKISDA